MNTQSVITNVSRPATSAGSTGNWIRKPRGSARLQRAADQLLEGVLAARRGADAVTAADAVLLRHDGVAVGRDDRGWHDCHGEHEHDDEPAERADSRRAPAAGRLCLLTIDAHLIYMVRRSIPPNGPLARTSLSRRPAESRGPKPGMRAGRAKPDRPIRCGWPTGAGVTGEA